MSEMALGPDQRAEDFVDVERFTEERTITVVRFGGRCRICGWEGHAVDSPHSNTVFWEVARHIERDHVRFVPQPEPSASPRSRR